MMSVKQSVEWKLAGKPKYSEETCSSATLSTTNPSWTDLGSNPGRRGGRPAINRLSYATAFMESVDEKFWGMTVNVTLGINGFLDFVHHPVF
jgi:hypothetical protein